MEIAEVVAITLEQSLENVGLMFYDKLHWRFISEHFQICYP